MIHIIWKIKTHSILVSSTFWPIQKSFLVKRLTNKNFSFKEITMKRLAMETFSGMISPNQSSTAPSSADGRICHSLRVELPLEISQIVDFQGSITLILSLQSPLSTKVNFRLVSGSTWLSFSSLRFRTFIFSQFWFRISEISYDVTISFFDDIIYYGGAFKWWCCEQKAILLSPKISVAWTSKIYDLLAL